jgi:hypothetical protein
MSLRVMFLASIIIIYSLQCFRVISINLLHFKHFYERKLKQVIVLSGIVQKPKGKVYQGRKF